MTNPPGITVRLDALDAFESTTLVPEVAHRIDVVTPRTVLPLLVVRKLQAQSVVVMNNGAVDQNLAHRRVVFQRSSWSEDIRHHQIYLYDPATGGPDFLSLAWGQLSEDHWLVPDMARAVVTLAEALGCPEVHQRTYFGSSAGAFMALALMAHDNGSRAVINNAQFDWTRWMPTGVNALREARFGNLLPTLLRERYPDRTNVLTLLAARAARMNVQYHVNLASKHDRVIDYPMFHDFLVEHAHLIGDVEVHPYFDEKSGHNPLSKERTLSILNE
ncbi:hypothetical protein [Kocuria sp. SM24M-10]|uniref:hypothetical protein n=1 Tax=Kocuria sp. SM24M-10 TaxID=1660349 RepID=UPI00064B28CC|nr:hypothetical protein [Kocuria sp. SM24M-10]KLU08110.1 hypothetical protein ABL57_19750 [Kocuria sp. SM24M-10]